MKEFYKKSKEFSECSDLCIIINCIQVLCIILIFFVDLKFGSKIVLCCLIFILLYAKNSIRIENDKNFIFIDLLFFTIEQHYGSDKVKLTNIKFLFFPIYYYGRCGEIELTQYLWFVVEKIKCGDDVSATNFFKIRLN